MEEMVKNSNIVKILGWLLCFTIICIPFKAFPFDPAACVRHLFDKFLAADRGWVISPQFEDQWKERLKDFLIEPPVLRKQIGEGKVVEITKNWGKQIGLLRETDKEPLYYRGLLLSGEAIEQILKEGLKKPEGNHAQAAAPGKKPEVAIRYAIDADKGNTGSHLVVIICIKAKRVQTSHTGPTQVEIQHDILPQAIHSILILDPQQIGSTNPFLVFAK